MNNEESASNVVPILTEMVPELSREGSLPVHTAAKAGVDQATLSHLPLVDLIDEDALVDRVMESLEKQIDHMFEFRVREALQPTLDALASRLAQETREQLAMTLRDVVRRSVNQEILKIRQRRG